MNNYTPMTHDEYQPIAATLRKPSHGHGTDAYRLLIAEIKECATNANFARRSGDYGEMFVNLAAIRDLLTPDSEEVQP
jgi:hypothetical protein